MKIAIFGSGGFLGTKLRKNLSQRGHLVFGTDTKETAELKIDAINYSEVRNFLISKNPDLVINTIALTNSVECEKNPQMAKKLNYQTAKNISDASKEIGAKMIFISSSYVFDGEEGDYNEEDVPSPKGVYAQTKFLAEEELLKEKNNLIFRVDLLLGYNGKNNPNGIFDKVLLDKDIFVGNPNQIRSPLFVDDVAEIIERLYSLKRGGIFHLASSDRIKMKDFLTDLEKLVRNNSKIKLIKNKPLLVPEKKNSSLESNKLLELNIKTTSVKDALTLIKKDL